MGNEKRSDEKAREAFRKGLYQRIGFLWGDLTGAASACGVARNTMYSWGREGGPLPDLYKAYLIAKSRSVSPSWLAFELGPRELSNAEAAFELGKLLSAHSGLADILEAYCLAEQPDKEIIHRIALHILSAKSKKHREAQTLPAEQRSESKKAGAKDEELRVIRLEVQQVQRMLTQVLEDAALDPQTQVKLQDIQVRLERIGDRQPLSDKSTHNQKS